MTTRSCQSELVEDDERSEKPKYSMKKIVAIFAFAGLIMLSACESQHDKSLKNIQQLEAELKANKDKPVSLELANKMIDAYLFFADNFQKDTLAVNYLFKAADVASGTKQSLRAVVLFNKFYQKYPNDKKAPYALFLKGFVYETQLSDFFKARESYETFIARYPQHQLGATVQFSLDNLGRSNEELVKEFEAKLNEGKEKTEIKK